MMLGLPHQADGLMEEAGQRYPSLLPLRVLCELKGRRAALSSVCPHVNWVWWLCPQRGEH